MMNRKQTPQINKKELELLSAYLDGQLPEATLRKVRMRLGQDPVFRAAYQDLKMTRQALRSAPQYKRRRSFTLTPEMASEPARSFGLQAASQLVAVVATVLLVAVFAGDVFFSRSSTISLLRSENTAADFYAEDTAELEMYGPENAAGGGAPPEAMEQAAEEAPAPAEAAAEMAEEAAEEPAADEDVDDRAGGDENAADEADEGFTASSPLPTATLAVQGTQAPEAAPTEEPAEETVLGMGEESEPTDGEVMKFTGSQGYGPSEFLEIEPEPEFPWLQVVEVGLLGIAVVSGAVAVVAKRRQ